LAEKFDVAALVYNITTLEKLRWSIKNSDTPRALLDALMLRFTLSEHFLNVDELLSQIKAGPVKKKVAGQNPTATAEVNSAKSQIIEHRESSVEQLNKSETTANDQPPPDHRANRAKTSRRRNEIINDPAVKTVLMGLDATITGIDEEQ